MERVILIYLIVPALKIAAIILEVRVLSIYISVFSFGLAFVTKSNPFLKTEEIN